MASWIINLFEKTSDTTKDTFLIPWSAIANAPDIPAEVTESTVLGWGFTKNAVEKSGDTMTGSLTIQEGNAINASQYNDAGGVSLMNNGGGTAAQFGSSARPARMFSSVRPEWYKNGASQGVFALTSDIPDISDKANVSGQAFTGGISAPNISTGTDAANYFQSQKFRGEGNADTYYHAIDFGYAGHNQVDFHEYGGVYNFYQNTNGALNTGSLVGAFTPDGIKEGNQLLKDKYLGKSGGTVTGDLTVGGNLTINGTTATVDSTTLQVKDKLIEVAHGNTTSLTTPAGLVAPKYDGTNSGALVFDSTGTAYVGDVTLKDGNIDVVNSELQPLATRTGLVGGNLVQYDSSALTLKDSGKKISDLALKTDVSGKLSKTENTGVNVLGTTKSTTTLGGNQLVAPNGIIFAGTAANAGLVTRGICGVSTPDSNGACSKANLYINYDGNNDFNVGRQVVLNAGTVGNHLGSNMYQYAVPRGEIVKNWVEAKGYATSVKVNDNTIASSGGVVDIGTVLTDASKFATSAQGTKADNAMPKSGGTFTGNISLPKELIFTNETNPFIKMRTGGTDFYFQSTSGQFGLGPTWNKATHWDSNGNVTFPTTPKVGSSSLALVSDIHGGTLTIQKNGTNVATFGANQSTNATANITVPTKVSELTNDSGFITNAPANYTNSSRTPSQCTANGFYYVTSSTNSLTDADGNPFLRYHASNNDFRILATAYNGNWVQQIATDFRSTHIYYRIRNNGTWGAWTEIAKISDIPDISGKANLSGGNTFTGTQTLNSPASDGYSINAAGYVKGSWLQSSATSNKGANTGKVCVFDDAGWVYYRTPKEVIIDAECAVKYELKKTIDFGQDGALYVGKFKVYDTNVTCEITSTTDVTYSGKLVIATQNYVISESKVYGDAANTVAPNFFIKPSTTSDPYIEVYFKPSSWSKNVVHIYGSNIQAEPTNVCTNIPAVPSTATSKPKNALPIYSLSGTTLTITL